MMKGLIDFLVSNAPEARALREKFVFKIVPMINVDGVINGNYRCSLCGSDLNRRYKTPSKILHPSIHAIKRFAKAFSKERELALYIDLHGHSRKKNVFMYGNSNVNPFDQANSRLFPYILSKLCDFFSFESCRFSMHRSKESTARIAMYRELKVPAIFTLEASFSGADMGQFKDHHFTTDHFMLLGRKVLETLIVYQKIDVQQVLLEASLKHAKPKPTQGAKPLPASASTKPSPKDEEEKKEDGGAT
jgi:cytosolic carboxypeptidase protein 2/3